VCNKELCSLNPNALHAKSERQYFCAAADVLLWRNKKISASVLATGTAIWVLFELLEYHLLTLVCHILIFTLAILFLWANASTFINK